MPPKRRHMAAAAAVATTLDTLAEDIAALRRQRYEEQGNTASIPIFSGDVEGLSTFLDRFDVSSIAYGWTQDERCQRFPMYLRDHALDVYRDIAQNRRTVFTDMIN